MLVNDKITAPKVRLIDNEGKMLGVVSIEEALKVAEQQSLDLVEISPGLEPPVCKIMNFGRHKFEMKRKDHKNKKKHKVSQVKEIKLRPVIGKHDYDVKIRSVIKFLNAGDKVKFSLYFKGREFTHMDVGMDLMIKIKEETQEIAKVELEPKLDRKRIIMILSPR